MRTPAYILYVCALFLSAISYGQSGTIVTYTTGSYCNIAVDGIGRLYSATGTTVRRIDSGGATTTVAGGATAYGDGGPATAAHLTNANHMAFDHWGNMYIADGGNGTIRKVNSAGIITTVAGTGTAGYTGDGGPATAAQIRATTVCPDIFGNIYIADLTAHVIRKVNTAGIITTVAGNGTAGFSGDGGPATAASLDHYTETNNWGIAVDNSGNLYISAGHNYRVRKVNTAGIISTYAGNGSTGSSGIGGPATSANVYYPQGLTTDGAGKLYIAEWQNCVLAVVNTTGILETVAGNYTISFSGDGCPATAAGMNAVSDVALDPYGNIYIADCHNSRVRKVIVPAATIIDDSFTVGINKMCSGPQLSVITQHYTPGSSVKTYFGDGTSSTTTISPGACTGSATVLHNYVSPGNYTIKMALYHGTTAVDSFHTSYSHVHCMTKPIRYYYDGNSNCNKDTFELFLTKPVLTEVDSNGIVIDTISSIGSFYYYAYGNPGDIYKYKVISSPPGMAPTCPSSGIIVDTLGSTTAISSTSFMAFACTSSGGYDLAEYAVIPVTGMHDQWGNIYVSNTSCLPSSATVTLYFSPKYQYNVGWARPTPASTTATSITWNVGSMSTSGAPISLYYAIFNNVTTGYLTAGDTVREYITVTPSTGDIDTSNNTELVIDTVRASCDPNEIEVSPSGHITAGTQLQYTVHFENTGTDTAFNISVLDTLSDYLDASTFRMVMSSVPEIYVSKSKTASGQTVMKFDFPNINLLDSTHRDSCIAAFVYTINSKLGLPDCTHIVSRAGIYFDYNSVCMTNEAENIIGCLPSLGIRQLSPDDVAIFPNPATTILNIKSTGYPYNSFAITNAVGVAMVSETINQGNTKIDIGSFPTGVYFITLKGDNGNVVKKFIKM